jgi:large subunit ribosomal protein L13e
VDHRRRNHCEESLKTNADRLAAYKNKLVVFPRKAGAKHVKKGDSTKKEIEKAGEFATHRRVMPVVQDAKRCKSEAIGAE